MTKDVIAPRAPSTAAEYFGGMADAYDDLIRRAVPRYEEMTERLVAYLPARAHRILELGCGTGTLSLALANRHPDAAVTCVDAAPEMTAITRARLAGRAPAFADRAGFVVQRFEMLGFAPGAFDLVTSSISLHHVRDKAGLYRAIRTLLADGGHFVFADQMLGASEAIQAINWARWLAYCRLPGHCTEEEVASLLAHAEAHDHYTPVREHFALMEAAGFREIDCVWRDGSWGIVTGSV